MRGVRGSTQGGALNTHPSLWRPITLFGVEVLTVAAECIVTCAIVVMGGVHPWAILAGLSFATLLHTAALPVGRIDPLLPWAYLRSLGHPDYLQARPRLGARPARAAVSVPRR
jgi:type IV secretory pathway TrbD component